MIRDDVDLLVANEHELKSLYQTDDLEAAMARAEAEIAITACTVGAGGAHVLAGGERVHAPAVGDPGGRRDRRGRPVRGRAPVRHDQPGATG